MVGRVVAIAGLVASSALLTSHRADATVVVKQKGVAIFTVDLGSAQKTLSQAALTYTYVKSLGANAVALNFPFQISGFDTNDPSAIPGITPSATLLGQLVALAKQDHLMVALRPLLAENTLGKHWRGQLAPTNITTWFTNYAAFLHPYLVMAKAQAANSFYISNEFDSLVSEYPTKWVSFVKQARTIYKGTIYSSTPHSKFIPVSSAAAAYDDYDSVFVPDSATVATLTTGLETDLSHDRIPGKLSNLVLSEVGIAGAHGAYVIPYNFGLGPTVIRPIQTNWFTAMCNLYFADHLAGIYFWMLNLATFSPTEDDSASPTNWVATPSEAAIKTCFARTA